SFRGRTIGKSRRALVSETVDGKRRLTLAIDDHYRFAAGGRPPAESSSRRLLTMTADWTPISIEETVTGSGKVTKRSVRILPGKAVFTLASGETREVPFKGNLVAEMSGEALAARGLLKVGKGLTAAVPDPAQAGLVLLRAAVIGEKTVEGRKDRLLLVNVRTAGGEQEWDLLVDRTGRLVEQSTGDMVRKRVEAAQAVLPDRPEALGGGVIPLSNAPAAFHRLTSMTVVLEFPEIVKDAVPELPGQAVVEAGRKVTAKLSERRPNGLLPPEKLENADRKKWLEPENEPAWRDAKIRAAAAKITAGTRGDLRRGFLIGRWVHRNLVKSLGGAPEASADDALKTRTGDCSEHAALFAALCRAAGIPARTAYGLAGSNGALRFHVWSEYYAGGRWIPLDTAIGRYGLPACYLTLSYDREQGGVRLFKFYAAARGRVTDCRERRPGGSSRR
ncbi:MAG: transglutaminase-like domain-containing protein, partial [Planctomycetota bacterium]